MLSGNRHVCDATKKGRELSTGKTSNLNLKVERSTPDTRLTRRLAGRHKDSEAKHLPVKFTSQAANYSSVEIFGWQSPTASTVWLSHLDGDKFDGTKPADTVGGCCSPWMAEGVETSDCNFRSQEMTPKTPRQMAPIFLEVRCGELSYQWYYSCGVLCAVKVLPDKRIFFPFFIFIAYVCLPCVCGLEHVCSYVCRWTCMCVGQYMCWPEADIAYQP